MKHNNCKLVNWKILSKENKRLGRNEYLACKFCKTHNVVVCRCGWPFSEHPPAEHKIVDNIL